MNKQSIFVIVSSIVIIGAGVYSSHNLNSRPQFNFVTVNPVNVVQGVSTNGTVQAQQNVNLSFQGSGTITSVRVQANSLVKAGQVLASLNSRDASASLDQAQAALAVAQANYQKVLVGATSQQAQVAQTALDNAKSALAATQSQQATAVQNAYSTLLNTSFTAVPGGTNTDGATVTVSGTYTGTAQGVYNVSIYSGGGGPQFQVQGLETATGYVRTTPTSLGTKGLYIQFSNNPSSADTWSVTIPNTYATTYVANNNAYQAALQTQTQSVTAAQSAVNSAQANLELTQSAARPEDVAAAKAQVDAAQANLETAQSTYSKTSIVAPFDGTVTEVDAKVGQTAAAGAPEIGMISAQKFQAIGFISQTDLGKINLNDPAQITLDAYGTGAQFPATVVAIDPNTTLVNNVPGYKITLQFTNVDDQIKDGLNANIDIIDKTDSAVLAVPASALFTQNQTDLVLKQNPDGSIVNQQVQTGIVGLDNMVEIKSGLNQNDKVVYFGK